MFTVPISEIAEQYNLTTLTKTVDITSKMLSDPYIHRPALQLAGFYDYFDRDRLQLIGKVEYSYLSQMPESDRIETIKKLFGHGIPCLVICRGLEPFPEMIKYAEEYGVPLLLTKEQTMDFMSDAIRWLKVRLAPRVTMHGVLVDIYGEGLLITGDSGVGKSETALELIKRGHRLVADDVVEVKKVSDQTLIGSCPETLRYFLELRGIGIIDVQNMFGVESVKETQNIDLVIKLEIWDNNSNEYDRLGLTDEYIEILGNNIVCHKVPIRPGRNLAVICESAALNRRQKKMGHNSAEVLRGRVFKND